MTEEDEAFNEIERLSKVKQTLIVHPSKEAMLLAKVAEYEALIRDLTDALRVQRTWVGLTELEKAEITNLKWWDWEDTFDIDGFIKAIETKLKEKNT